MMGERAGLAENTEVGQPTGRQNCELHACIGQRARGSGAGWLQNWEEHEHQLERLEDQLLEELHDHLGLHIGEAGERKKAEKKAKSKTNLVCTQA